MRPFHSAPPTYSLTRSLTHPLTRNPPPRHPPHAHAVAEKSATSDYLTRENNVRLGVWARLGLPSTMSLSSFSSLSSYSSESDVSLSTIFDFGLFKTSTSRARRKRTPEPARPRLIKDTHTRRSTRKRSVTPTRTPVSSRYDDRAAVVPYSHGLRSPSSRSGISYSDIDRWRATTIGGSDFTYSSTSSISQSSVTTSSVVSSSRTRSSRIDTSSRRSTAFAPRQLKGPSATSQHPHPGIRHDPLRICEHCRTAFPLAAILTLG